MGETFGPWGRLSQLLVVLDLDAAEDGEGVDAESGASSGSENPSARLLTPPRIGVPRTVTRQSRGMIRSTPPMIAVASTSAPSSASVAWRMSSSTPP